MHNNLVESLEGTFEENLEASIKNKNDLYKVIGNLPQKCKFFTNVTECFFST